MRLSLRNYERRRRIATQIAANPALIYLVQGAFRLLRILLPDKRIIDDCALTVNYHEPGPLALNLDRNGLDLRILLQGILAHLPPDAGLLETAGRGGGVENIEAVHPDCACFDVVRDRVCLADVARPNGGRKPIRRVVCTLNHLVKVAESDDAHYWPENLFARNLHFILDIGKHGRLDEEAIVSDGLSAHKQIGALPLACINVGHHPIELCAINLRALLDGRIKRVADSTPGGARNALFHEFVIDLVFDEQARARAADLALVEEEPEMAAFNRLLHVGIGENNVRAFSTQFQASTLEVGFSGRLQDESAHFCRAGKGDFVDVHVIGDRRSSGRSITRKNIDYACREARLLNQFSNLQCGERSLLGGFEHDRVAGGQSRSEFHPIHEKREIPWSDLADDTHGLMSRVAEIITVNGNRLALILVGPSREVTELPEG